MPPGEIESGLWVRLENRFYRYRAAYESIPLTESTKEYGALSSALVFAAGYGGVVGMIGNQGWGIDFPLLVFTGAGRLLAKVPSKHQYRVVAGTWLTQGDTNVCILAYEDGTVAQVEIACGTGKEIWNQNLIVGTQEKITDATFCFPDARLGQCVVLRTASGEFIWACHLEEREVAEPQKIVQIFEDVYPVNVVPKRDRQTAVTTMQAQIRNDGSLVVYANDYRNRLWRVDSETGQSQSINLSCRNIEMSRDQAMLAICEENGEVNVISTVTLETIVSANVTICDYIAWCGNDSLCLASGNRLTLIGPRSGHVSIEVGSGASEVIIWSEPDGLRVWSSDQIGLVDLVAPAVERTLGPASKQTARKLLDATEKTSAVERHVSMQTLHLEGTLDDAVADLFQSAGREYDPSLQQRILNAASYGANFLHSENPCPPHAPDSRLSHTCSRLRVLNIVRNAEVGIAVSAKGLSEMGIGWLLDRICALEQHSLALELSAFAGGTNTTRVLASWGSYTIRRDPAGVTTVVDQFLKMQTNWGLEAPFGEVAEVALKMEAIQAARILICHEKRPTLKVQVLTELGDSEEALITAAQCMDSDCLTSTILGILNRGTSGALHSVLRVFRSRIEPRHLPRALNVLATALRQLGKRSELNKVYAEMGLPHETANISVQLISSAPSEERADRLERLANHLMRTTGARKATVVFESNAIRSAAMVSAVGSRLESRIGLPVGSLLRVSSSELLAIAAVKLPEHSDRGDHLARIRRDLRIPDRRFFWMCLTAMSSVDDFRGLELLCAGGGEPPIGFGPFVEACLKRKNVKEATKYAHRVSDARERARALARCGLGREGAEIAARLNNQTLMEEVASLAVGSLPLLQQAPGG